MNLEKRVEMLEQEVEVLKSQIQSTLLDIKEHLLTNAYPELRADVPQASQAPQEKQGYPTQSIPVNHVTPVSQVAQMLPPEDSGGPIPVRQVSLESLEAQKKSHPVEPAVKPQQQLQPQKAAPKKYDQDWTSMAQLEEWLTGKLQEMGPERTEKLIYLYAENGHFDEETARTLLRLLELYYEQVSHHQPEPPQATNNHLGEAPQIDDYSHENQKKESENQHPRQEEMRGKKRGRSRPNISDPRAFLDQTQSADELEEGLLEKEQENKPNSLVLRLIAGVQNAGASVRWRRNKNG